MKKIKVAIADDHALIREGIKKLLELEDNFEIVALAGDGIEALECIRNTQPDVILLDINMPNMNGIDCLKQIKTDYPETKVIMLTIHEDAEYLIETINIGAEGYVLKDADVSSLVKAIQKVVQGEVYIHPTLSGILVREYKRKDKNMEDVIGNNLTKREFEVIRLISRGYNNKEIAIELFISEKTVKNHVSNIFKKIKVTDRTQAALYAIKHNITKI
ncbi:response regulator transcription factor [Fusibacter bizertensis]|uniref:Stage 0 sporulation protein A homolog n=1 Tax=Fusibacter bizertensis TaxID=1488331 RepID=A0ABT6NFF2_9FIRM|nr:response regulator transcription factor [Fusibacter bizertensis]MDH8679108.1 response regulator transcription factor [Fusibacter bizertensis]